MTKRLKHEKPVKCKEEGCYMFATWMGYCSKHAIERGYNKCSLTK